MREYFSEGERSWRLDRKDRVLMYVLTLVYTVFTLINLGTLRFPTTVWEAPAEGSVVLDLGQERHVGSLWFNGNIAAGTLLITADDGGSFVYEQVYGEMFSWRIKNVDFRTRFLRLERTGGSVSLNEMAVFDPEGDRFPVTAADGTGEALIDEASAVPEKPGCFNGMIFDEIYHARTAYEFLHTMSVYEWTHPPLGKEIIALGVLIFGMKPFGWRVMPALFGAAMLPLMFTLGKRLFRRRDYAFLGAALFALDTMHYAQTRIATVDVFVVFFILMMYLFMADFLRADSEDEPLRRALVPLGACGISFGLGTAAKWTGLYAGAGLAVIFFAHLIRALAAAERGEARRARWNRTWDIIAFCCVFFLAIPALIYFLSYIPFYRYEAAQRGAASLSLREMLDVLIRQQESMYSYHSNLTATHSSQSAWYEWPFTAVSVWFYFRSGETTVSNISTFGSPAVWWTASLGTMCAIVEAACGRFRDDALYRKKALAFLLTAVGANYLPWTLVTRCVFQYHFFPTIPFALLCGVLLLQHLEEAGEVSPKVKWYWLIAAAVYFLLLLPACSGLPMTRLYARFIEYVLPAGNLFHGAV